MYILPQPKLLCLMSIKLSPLYAKDHSASQPEGSFVSAQISICSVQEISTFPHFCKMEVLRRMLVSLSSSKRLFKNSFLMVKQTKKLNESPYHCDIANRKFFYDNKICKHLCNLLKGRQKTRRATCCTAGQNCSI